MKTHLLAAILVPDGGGSVKWYNDFNRLKSKTHITTNL